MGERVEAIGIALKQNTRLRGCFVLGGLTIRAKDIVVRSSKHGSNPTRLGFF
jgi:hypothetical protein